jgi:hypothetical protein
MALNAVVPIDPPKKRRGDGSCTVTLEIWQDSCRLWDNVNETQCGEPYYYSDDVHPVLANGRKLTDMPFFAEVFSHLAELHAAHRKDPLGEYLAPTIVAMETALAKRDGTCVYFAEADGRIKIGWSRKVATRVAQLQTGSPVPIKLLGVTPGGRSLERELHHRFAADRLTGEWFTATPELLACIAAATS